MHSYMETTKLNLMATDRLKGVIPCWNDQELDETCNSLGSN